MDEETEIEIITTYFEEPDIEILPGDPILITELLAHNVSKRLCTQEYVKVCLIVYPKFCDKLIFYCINI